MRENDNNSFSEFPYSHEMRRVDYLPPHFMQFKLTLDLNDTDEYSISLFKRDWIARIVLEKCHGRYFFDSYPTVDNQSFEYRKPTTFIIAFEDEKDAQIFDLHSRKENFSSENSLDKYL
jgi:hypothetical protein